MIKYQKKEDDMKIFGIAIIAIFIFAAVITPTTDIFNMSLLAIPMLFLYELSIWVSYFARAKAKQGLPHHEKS